MQDVDMNKQIVDERQVKRRWQIETQASGSVGRYIKKRKGKEEIQDKKKRDQILHARRLGVRPVAGQPVSEPADTPINCPPGRFPRLAPGACRPAARGCPQQPRLQRQLAALAPVEPDGPAASAPLRTAFGQHPPGAQGLIYAPQCCRHSCDCARVDTRKIVQGQQRAVGRGGGRRSTATH